MAYIQYWTRRAAAVIIVGGAAWLAARAAGEHARHDPAIADSAAPPTDSAFATVQARGAKVMGVDQYTSQHVFEDLPDGGRIVLVRDSADANGVATIRAHLRGIARAFTGGDFTLPGQVHDREVPGTRVMAERRATLRYEFVERAGGGEVRLTTTDAAALKAVREFLAFQRIDHRAPGHDHELLR